MWTLNKKNVYKSDPDYPEIWINEGRINEVLLYIEIKVDRLENYDTRKPTAKAETSWMDYIDLNN